MIRLRFGECKPQWSPLTAINQCFFFASAAHGL